MKKIFNVLFAVVILLTFSACESKGPSGRVIIPDDSIDELIKDTLDDDGWVYIGSIELHYKQNGEWISAGMFDWYKNQADDDSPNIWVDFSGFKSPAKHCSSYGYSYKVQYQGTWYYF